MSERKPKTQIAAYLIDRLYKLGVRHVFGIPGDYVLGFYEELVQSPIHVINTSDEQGAGFAADAYARVRGLGCVCVTYCVGGLKVANPIAGAYAEKSPVVVISGAPGLKEREKNPLLHHKVREFDTQKKVFEQITVAGADLSDPQTALQEIDRVLNAAMRHKRPVYIEIPRDMVGVEGAVYHKPASYREASDPPALEAALGEAKKVINAAKKPVILADLEIHRFGLQEELKELIDTTGIPFATTILGKSVLGEQHPLYLGVYEGAMGREEVRQYVESSDCVIMLGAFMTDINLGIFTARLEPERCLNINSEKIAIGYHNYEDVRFGDFLHGLLEGGIRSRKKPASLPSPVPAESFEARDATPVTVKRLFQCINQFIDEKTVVVTDIGDSLFGAVDLYIRHRTEFFGPAYYASMGFAVPAGIGAEFANPKLRPLIIVGDGAFQMTGMELGTAVRFGLKPIVVVLNNRGYGTERHLHDGPFNDIPNWNFSKVPEVLGAGLGFSVQTETELVDALEEAFKEKKQFSLVEVHLDPMDHSAALERLAQRLSKQI